MPPPYFLMARYSALFGRRIQVTYRASDIILPATGNLAADSGKSIFLEESFQQKGNVKTFRWEIPYPCIVKLNECPEIPRPSLPRKCRATPLRSPLSSSAPCNARRISPDPSSRISSTAISDFQPVFPRTPIDFPSIAREGPFMKPTVGFIGLGLMGRPMAANLLKAGYEVTVWNRTASRADALVSQGAKRAATPRDLAAASRRDVHDRQRSAGAGVGLVGRGGRVRGIAPRQRASRIEHGFARPWKSAPRRLRRRRAPNFWKRR